MAVCIVRAETLGHVCTMAAHQPKRVIKPELHGATDLHPWRMQKMVAEGLERLRIAKETS